MNSNTAEDLVGFKSVIIQEDALASVATTNDVMTAPSYLILSGRAVKLSSGTNTKNKGLTPMEAFFVKLTRK